MRRCSSPNYSQRGRKGRDVGQLCAIMMTIYLVCQVELESVL